MNKKVICFLHILWLSGSGISMPSAFAMLQIKNEFKTLSESSFSSPDSAIIRSEKILKKAIADGDQAEVAAALKNLGVVYDLQGAYSNAVKEYFKALEIYQALEDTSGIAGVLVNIGVTNWTLKNLDQALKFLHEAEQLCEQSGRNEQLISIYNNLGGIYQDKGDLLKAISYFKNSLRLAREFGAIVGIANCLNNIGILLLAQGHLQQAKTYFHTSLQLFDSLNEHEGKTINLFHLADIARKEDKVDSAIILARGSLAEAKKINSRLDIQMNYLLLSEIYEKKGELKPALEYYRSGMLLKDSIFNEKQLQQIEKLQVQYESEKQYIEIARLKEKQENQEAMLLQKDRFNYSLLISFTLLVILLGYIYFLYRKNLKDNLVLRAQNEEIESQRVALNKQNIKLKELDIEKNNIIHMVAHDLISPFHKISGLLNLIKMDGELNQSQNQCFDMIQHVIRYAVSNTRDLLDANRLEEGKISIQYAEVDLKNLVLGIINGFKEQAKKKDILIHCDLPENTILVSTDRDLLNRILDNLISNALKYSPPHRNIYIKLQESGSSRFPSISIKDEGPGFSFDDQKKLFRKFQKLSARPTGGENSNGLGLSIVKNLSEKLNYNISCESEPGKGATFTLELNNSMVDNLV